MGVKEEERWLEARSKVHSAIAELKEAGEGIDMDDSTIAGEIADLVNDELNINLEEC